MPEWLEYVAFRVFRLFRRMHLTRIIRLGSSTRIFTDCFKGFEKMEAVRGIFGEKTEEVLQKLKVEFTWFGGYMSVDDSNGHLIINSRYLNSGDKTDIYLDLVHELVHIKQYMDGRGLFDPRFSYVERPTEIEAYRYTVQEARRLGLTDERILQYLETEWMSPEDVRKLAETVKVKC